MRKIGLFSILGGLVILRAMADHKPIDAVVLDARLPLAVVGTYDATHPVVAAVEPETLGASTVNGTLAMLVNGGALQDSLVRIAHANKTPLLGSSANLTGAGTKFRVQDIEQPIVDAVDLVLQAAFLDQGVVVYDGPSVELVASPGPVVPSLLQWRRRWATDERWLRFCKAVLNTAVLTADG